jgi:hypothetical protein
MKEYLFKCREMYFKNITPSNPTSKNLIEYAELLDIANEIINKLGLDSFAEYFQEDHYLVSLWTAHIILEYYKPNENILIMSLDIIKDYTDNPLVPNISLEEKRWLEENQDKFKPS